MTLEFCQGHVGEFGTCAQRAGQGSLDPAKRAHVARWSKAGGSLSLVAEFPDRAPVVLPGIAQDQLPLKRAARKDTPPLGCTEYSVARHYLVRS